jgi:hypothetical protein
MVTRKVRLLSSGQRPSKSALTGGSGKGWGRIGRRREARPPSLHDARGVGSRADRHGRGVLGRDQSMRGRHIDEEGAGASSSLQSTRPACCPSSAAGLRRRADRPGARLDDVAPSNDDSTHQLSRWRHQAAAAATVVLPIAREGSRSLVLGKLCSNDGRLDRLSNRRDLPPKG